jgi:hypothetical protein
MTSIKPYHPGQMIQFGQNAGPWHMRFYGLVNNIKQKTMSTTIQEDKDRRILGVFGLSWAVFQSSMPKDVTDACEQAIETSLMPRMSYKNDTEGEESHFMILLY